MTTGLADMERFFAEARDRSRSIGERCAALGRSLEIGDTFYSSPADPKADPVLAKWLLETQAQMDRLFHDELRPALDSTGIELASVTTLDASERAYLERNIFEPILPVLTPLALDRACPLPRVDGRSLAVAFVLAPTERGVRRGHDDLFAMVQVPRLVRRLVAVPQNGAHLLHATRKLVPFEELVAAFGARLFTGYHVTEIGFFRVTCSPIGAPRRLELNLHSTSTSAFPTRIEERLHQVLPSATLCRRSSMLQLQDLCRLVTPNRLPARRVEPMVAALTALAVAS